MDKITLEKITEEDICLIEQLLENDEILGRYKLDNNVIDEIKHIDGRYEYIKSFMVNINSKKVGFCQYYGIDKENIRYYIDFFIDENYRDSTNESTIIKILMEKIKNEGGKEVIFVSRGMNALWALLENGFENHNSRRIFRKVL